MMVVAKRDKLVADIAAFRSSANGCYGYGAGYVKQLREHVVL